MKLNLLYVSSTSACFELENTSAYFAPAAFGVTLNGSLVLPQVKSNVFSLYDLTPATQYTVSTTQGDSYVFTTKAESAVLNILDFGAVGDGNTLNTYALQAAIHACPPQGRVLIPRGVYRTGALFLTSHLTLELQEGATLLGSPHAQDYPVLPGEVPNGKGGMAQVASWEGDPLTCHASLINAYYQTDIAIIGRGTLDGGALEADWWEHPKGREINRPKIFFANQCQNVYLHGLTVQNSPAWHLHPFFSQQLGFYQLHVTAPANSPNTDGCDPESCDDVEIIGVKFSVGDDAIALKSGKIYMGKTYQTPASNHRIRNCYIESAHGAIVLGSEMAGGVKDLDVRQCYFKDTDRGLRIKTRRGRGKHAVIDGVSFHNIIMDAVKTPIVMNMFYYCDPDGKTEYVWSKDALPVDDGTPYLGRFHFENCVCTDCAVAAGFFYGLPEQPIARVHLENVSFSFAADAKPGQPAMMSHLDDQCKLGLFFDGVADVQLENVSMTGQDGEALIAHGHCNITGEVGGV